MLNKHKAQNFDATNDLKLYCVEIDKWRSYSVFIDEKQERLQLDSLIDTGLDNGDGTLHFIFTKHMSELNDYLMSISESIPIVPIPVVVSEEVFYSTKIEGAKTTLVRTMDIYNGSSINMGNEYSERMVENSFIADKLLSSYSGKLTIDILVEVWNQLVYKVCDNETILGSDFRIGDVKVGKHSVPDYTQVETLMQQFCDFFNSNTYDAYLFVKASIIHYLFETIHPCCDGRLGRLLISYYLISRGIKSVRAVSFSMQIDARRERYGEVFEYSENKYNDCTPFIEYMLEVMAKAYNHAQGITRG